MGAPTWTWDNLNRTMPISHLPPRKTTLKTPNPHGAHGVNRTHHRISRLPEIAKRCLIAQKKARKLKKKITEKKSKKKISTRMSSLNLRFSSYRVRINLTVSLVAIHYYRTELLKVDFL